MSGHVGHQIEHHLFPTLPAHRAAAVAPEVRALCEKYGLPYTTGPLHRQLGSALRRVVRHALPNEVAVPAAVAPLYSALEARLPGLLPRQRKPKPRQEVPAAVRLDAAKAVLATEELVSSLTGGHLPLGQAARDEVLAVRRESGVAAG
jgi:hypothetical protein